MAVLLIPAKEKILVGSNLDIEYMVNPLVVTFRADTVNFYFESSHSVGTYAEIGQLPTNPKNFLHQIYDDESRRHLSVGFFRSYLGMRNSDSLVRRV